MKKKLLTIIIPTYNSKNTIIQCLNSIYAQVYDNDLIEVIIVDDGSTDETVSLIKTNFPCVKLYCQENKGVGSARNFGIKKATGNYIWFIDSDDKIVDNTLNHPFFELLNENYDLIIFGFLKNRNGNVEKNVTKMTIHFNKNQWPEYFNKVFSENAFNNLWNKIYKPDLLLNNKICFNDFISGEDGFFNCQYLEVANNIYISNTIKYEYKLFTKHAYKEKWNNKLHKDNLIRIHEFEKMCQLLKIKIPNVPYSMEITDTLLGEENNIFKKYKSRISFRKYNEEIKNIRKDYPLISNNKLSAKYKIKHFMSVNNIVSFLYLSRNH